MRADRLIAVLLLLQTRGRITAADVAQELEVSERTARRDLEALSMSGVPVYSTHGRGGGWELIGNARTDLSGLSAPEAQALFLAAGSAVAHSPELAASLRSGLRKLSFALPETFRDDAAAAAAAIKIDSSGWGQGAFEENVRHLDTLLRAVVVGRQVQISYGSSRSAPRDRVVHPLGLVSKRSIWYLIADTDVGLRTFRLSRVSELKVLDTEVVRPPDFDLDEAWDDVLASMASMRPALSVDALVDDEVLAPLRYTFGALVTVHEPAAEGRVRATIEDWSARSLAAQLAGFGNRITLIDPPDSVVTELRRISAELQQTWLTEAERGDETT